MSGGYFDYKQYRLYDIVLQIEELIEFNSDEYEPETIERFKEAIDILVKAEIMVNRIDWLVSGDDGETTFHERLNKKLCEIK